MEANLRNDSTRYFPNPNLQQLGIKRKQLSSDAESKMLTVILQDKPTIVGEAY